MDTVVHIVALLLFLLSPVLLLMIFIAANKWWDVLTRGDHDRLAQRQQQAEREIQRIGHQARNAIVTEALLRAQTSRSAAGAMQPFIEGEVVASRDEPLDDPWSPTWRPG